MVSRLYRRDIDEALKAYGLSEATILPIRYLARLGDNIRQGNLAEAMNIEGPTLARVLDQLVRLGYVSRTEDDGDRRAKIVSLTEAGKALNAKLSDSLNNVRQRLFGEAQDIDLQATLRVLSAIEKNWKSNGVDWPS